MVKQVLEGAEAKIISAARKVFQRDGMAGARMQDIADEAGINKALLHYYFRTKEKLFDLVFAEAAETFFPRVVDVIESDLPLFEKIEQFCDEYISMIMKHPFLPVFVIHEINRKPKAFFKKMWKNRKPPLESFVRQVQMEIHAGKIKTVNPAQLFLNMLALCVFPFMAAPMFMQAANIGDEQFQQLMESRKKEVPAFIIASIKK
jgi:AcrR family transcriptional regulator